MEIINSPSRNYERIRDERLARICPICANANTKVKEHQVEHVGFWGSKYRERDIRWCWYCDTVWADDWSRVRKKNRSEIALLNMENAAKSKIRGN